MLVQKNFTVVVRDPATDYKIVILPECEANVRPSIKNAIRDIKIWQGVRSGKKWPRFENFKSTPIDTLEIIVTSNYEVI